MPHDVFVSYATNDRKTADEVCASLENDGVACWIAPRDIVPGTEWGGAIVAALESAKVMILIFSASANDSPQVRREVQCAFERGVNVIPLRVENVSPAKSLEYYLKPVHWLDAVPPSRGHLSHLGATVKQLLLAAGPGGGENPRGGAGAAGARADEGVGTIIGAAVAASQGPRGSLAPVRATPLEYVAPPQGRGRGIVALSLAGAALLVAFMAAVLAYRFLRSAGTSAATPAAPATAGPPPVRAPASRPGSLQAVRDVLADLSTIDDQLGRVESSLGSDLSDAAAATTASALHDVAEGMRLRSIVNVQGTTRGAAGSGSADSVPDRLQALGLWGAEPQPVRELADDLFDARRTAAELPARYQALIDRHQLAAMARKLGLAEGAPPAEARFVERVTAQGVEEFRSRCLLAHLSALRVLRLVRGHTPSDLADRVDGDLSGLKHLAPHKLLTPAEETSRRSEASARLAKALADKDALAEEMTKLDDQAVDRWSAALQPPFKPGARPAAELIPLSAGSSEHPRVRPTLSPSAVVAAARQARIVDDTAGAVACFLCYAALFAPSDPSAEEFARAAAQLTLQLRRFDVEGGLYLPDVPDGPAKVAGLREGDVLTHVNSKPVADETALGAALRDMPANEPAVVDYLRRDDHGRFQRRRATLPAGGELKAARLPI